MDRERKYDMKPEMIETLRNSFARIAARNVDVATVFYARLFELAPSVRPMFKEDLNDQKQKLMTALVQIVQMVDKPEQFTSYLTRMGERHAAYGAKPEHYDTVGAALLWTFEQVLADEFSPEVREAWSTAYGAIAKIMCSATPPTETAVYPRVAAPDAPNPARSAVR